MDKREFKSLNALLAAWRAAVSGTSLPQPPAYQGPDVWLSGLVEHSDRVEPGACFVARVRTESDGHLYLGRAAERGASLLIGQRRAAEAAAGLDGIPYWQVEDTALVEAWLAAAWHGFPARQLVMVGVTGTDGKTTTVNLIHAILLAAGLRAGMLSTIKASLGDTEEPLALHVTTPEAPVVQEYLRRMVDAGLSHCVLEATSHGLAQHRVEAIDFDLAVVTNITHEHLDYHGDLDAYRATKARLFASLSRPRVNVVGGNPAKEGLRRTAVLNADDGSFAYLATIAAPRRLTYGRSAAADVTAANVAFHAAGTHFDLHLPSGDGERSRVAVESALVGDFNVDNMLAAAAAGNALGLPPSAIRDGLASVRALSGRWEPIDAGQPFQVVVDFAHTPNALERALRAARRKARGRVIAVFGSAGKRDVAKRRLMAEAAGRLADLNVLTAEDPRTEALDDILAEMADGCRSQGGVEGETFWRVPDRGQAIYFALTLAEPADLVLICGKGHEQSMCFGATEYPWDDRDATRTALEAFLAGRPMPDLGLPTYAGLTMADRQ
jgi:UDP-N-acetylmuramoyl-L-alanyl-D-glutamate--2,6-diaminopimelate ligase